MLLLCIHHSADHKESAMIRVVTGPATKSTSPRTPKKTPCTHSRLVDVVLTATGNKTGQLVCVECTAVFPDPALKKPASRTSV